MNNQRMLELAMRHGALRARIDEQRRLLGRQVVPLENAFSRGDDVLRGVDWLKHHPAAIGAAVAAAVIIRPRRAFAVARRGFFLWRGWQAVRKSLFGAG